MSIQSSSVLYRHPGTGSSLFFTLFFLLSSLACAQAELSTGPLSPSAASDEETSLFQEIPSVYGASKYEQKVTEAPAAVTIITSDEIKKYGYRTLADLLQSVNGFFVTSDRNYSYVGIRGFNRPGDYNTRVLLLVDGHRLNDDVYDQAGIGTESPIDIDTIDRVEIIRGPSSSLYGTNAFFGVLNLITKRGRDVKGLEASTEIGSYGSYKGRVTYGNKFSHGLEVFVSGSVYQSEGHPHLFFKEFNDPATNYGIARDGDNDRSYNWFTKLSYRDFLFEGGYMSRKKGIPTAAFGTVFNTTRTNATDEHGYVDLKYDHEFAHQVKLMAELYYDRYDYRGRYLYDYGESPSSLLVLNEDFSLGEWWGTEIKLTKTVLQRHKLALGAEYRDHLHQDQRNFDTQPFFSYLHSRRDSQDWAFYAQDEFAILDNLLLNAGVRYDYYDSFGGTTNPRLALIYNLPKTTFKILYGEAFRAPNAHELLYGSDYKGAAGQPRPLLKPENITTYELVLERSLGNHLRGAASAYYYTIDKLISQQTDPLTGLPIFRNVDAVEAKGLEFELEGRWASDLECRLSYAVQETENQKTGQMLTNSPRHLVKGNLIVPILKEKLFAGIEARYMSGRKTLAGNTAGDFFIANLTLFSQNLLRGVEVSGSIYNLFDNRYSDPGAIQHRQDVIEQDGRTFWLKLKYGF